MPDVTGSSLWSQPETFSKQTWSDRLYYTTNQYLLSSGRGDLHLNREALKLNQNPSFLLWTPCVQLKFYFQSTGKKAIAWIFFFPPFLHMLCIVATTNSSEKQRKLRTLSSNVNIRVCVIHKLIRIGIIISTVNLIISVVLIVTVIYT